jgi:hypothetical protein
MVDEMRAAREAQSRPLVLVNFEIQGDEIIVRIGNYGNGPATNIRFRSDPALLNSRGQDVGSLPPLGTPIPLLRPGGAETGLTAVFDKVASYFQPGIGYFLGSHQLTFVAVVGYDDPLSGKTYPDTRIMLDLNPLAPFQHLPRPGE